MRLLLIALIITVACLLGVASVQLPDSAQAAVDHYKAMISAAESASSPQSLEAAFAALRPVQEALLHCREGSTLLESLSEQEYQRVQRQVVGARINREESVFVVPDPDYFVTLAAAHGEKADQAFFRAFKATHPAGIWHVYVEQQTDYSGCTRFGSMSLVDTYGSWTEFRSHFPGRYVSVVSEELSAVIAELTESTCPCGDLASVEKELSCFIQKFRDSPDRPAVETRLKNLRTGESKFRERCISG